MFVTFEGVDGSGKSTQARLLADWLRAQGRTVLLAREPGQTALGESVRDLVLHGEEMAPWTEAALFAAARAELVAREVRPALERGEDVLLDRYLDSSVAYQGAARGLGEEAVRSLSLTVTGGLLPDRTFLIALDPAAARTRGDARPDRIEREDEAFAGRVADGYRRVAEREPERVVAVDGARDPETIAEEIRERIRDLL